MSAVLLRATCEVSLQHGLRTFRTEKAKKEAEHLLYFDVTYYGFLKRAKAVILHSRRE